MSGRLRWNFGNDEFDHSFAVAVSAAADENDDENDGEEEIDDDDECVSLISSTLSMTCDPYIVPDVVSDPKVHNGRRESSWSIQDKLVTSSECYRVSDDDNDDDNDNDDGDDELMMMMIEMSFSSDDDDADGDSDVSYLSGDYNEDGDAWWRWWWW